MGFALALPATTLAETTKVAQDLETAEQAYANLEYQDAGKLADRILKQRGLTHDQLVRATRLSALTYAVLGNESAAKDAFVALLAYDPEYQADPLLGPRVQGPYFEARGFWRSQSQVPGMAAMATLRERDGGQIRVSIKDPTHLARKVVVGYRWGATGNFETGSLGATGGDVDIPEPPASATRLDYFAQATDDRDSVVFESGSRGAPKSAFVTAKPATTTAASGDTGFFSASNPWLWIVGGAVLAAGGAGAYFATRPGTPQTFTLTPVARCGGEDCR
jgi:hypothetical protein